MKIALVAKKALLLYANMRKRQNAIPAEQIRDEIRKLNQIGKSQIYRSFDKEAAVDLIFRLGVPGAETEVQGMPTEVRISLVIKYRLLVGGVGIAYEGGSESEAGRQFNLFMAKSKNPKSRSAGEMLTLFKSYEIIRRHHLLILSEA
jgi:hypothetical protein